MLYLRRKEKKGKFAEVGELRRRYEYGGRILIYPFRHP